MNVITDVEQELDVVEDAIEGFIRRKPKPKPVTPPIVPGSTGIVTTANIVFINESTVISNTQLAALVPDLQTQVVKDFAPAWGHDAILSIVDKHVAPPATSWQLVILDDSDQAGALGYHDVTAAGLPIGKVFARTDLQNGLSWQVTVSHELLEMLGDPEINSTIMLNDAQGNVMVFAYEACDAVEADRLGYQIGTSLVSNFVLPSFFGARPQNPGVSANQYDFRGQITVNIPDALAKGNLADAILPEGYLGYWTPTAGWVQFTGAARANDYSALAAPGSRRERRTSSRTPIRSLEFDRIVENRRTLRNRLIAMYPES